LGQGTYARCLDCSCIYLRERPTWEEIKAGYSSQEGAANPGSFAPGGLDGGPGALRRFLHYLSFRPHSWPESPATPERNRLLDVGCGNGAKLVEFANRGYEIWGTDVSGDALAAALKKVPRGTFFKAELPELALPGGAFHYIRLDNVLEHLPQPLAMLQECRRLLAPGGQLLIYVPNGNSPSVRFLGRYSISSWIPYHLTLFTPKSLKMLCAQAGFNDVHLSGWVPTSWPPLSIMQLIWKRRTWLRSPLVPGWLAYCFRPLGIVRWPLFLAEEIVARAQ
jgi:SAM-dependent methyltransferase